MSKILLSIVMILSFLMSASAVGAEHKDTHNPNGGNGHTPVTICHITGNGSYHLITVDDNAVPAHMDHGDRYPDGGECPQVVTHPEGPLPTPDDGREEPPANPPAQPETPVQPEVPVVPSEPEEPTTPAQPDPPVNVPANPDPQTPANPAPPSTTQTSQGTAGVVSLPVTGTGTTGRIDIRVP